MNRLFSLLLAALLSISAWAAPTLSVDSGEQIDFAAVGRVTFNDATLPWERARGPPDLLALSTTQHTSPRWVFSAAPLTFDLPLITTLAPAHSQGSATPTFTRALAALAIDFEGRYVSVKADAARMDGTRIVHNLFNISENAATPTVTGTTPPTASKVTYGGKSNVQAVTFASGTASGADAQANWLAKFSAGVLSGWQMAARLLVATSRPLTGSEAITISWNGNTSLSPSLVLTASSQPGAALTIMSPGVQTAAGSNTLSIYLNPTASLTSDITVYLTEFQLEFVSGQTNQNPGPYVSSGVLPSAPYHGLGVDGIQSFDTLNANTVSSNVVTEATGVKINSSQAAAAGGVTAGVVDASGPVGYLAEQASTQIIPNTADIRDMTQVTWTKGATMTVAHTAIGADGVANAANTVTGGAVAATNTITYLVTAAATSRTYSALVKLVSGSDPVLIEQGATTSDITSQLIVGSYVKVSLTASVLNATIGFKINGTGGTVLNIDMNMFEAGSVATSPIVTGGGARPADVLTYPTAGNISATAGSAYAEVANIYTAASWPAESGIIGNNATAFIALYGSGTTLNTYDSVAPRNLITFTPATSVSKVSNAWGGTSVTGAVNGTLGTPQTYSVNSNPSAISIGIDGAATSFNGHIRNVRIWQTALPSSSLTTLTSP